MYTLVRLDAHPLVSTLMLLQALYAGSDLVLYSVKDKCKLYLANSIIDVFNISRNARAESPATPFSNLIGNAFNREVVAATQTLGNLIEFQSPTIQQRFNQKARNFVDASWSFNTDFYDINNANRTAIFRRRQLSLSTDMFRDYQTSNVTSLLSLLSEAPDATSSHFTPSQILSALVRALLSRLPQDFGANADGMYSGGAAAPYINGYHPASYMFPYVASDPCLVTSTRSRSAGLERSPQVFIDMVSMFRDSDCSDSHFIEDGVRRKLRSRVSYSNSFVPNHTFNNYVTLPNRVIAYRETSNPLIGEFLGIEGNSLLGGLLIVDERLKSPEMDRRLELEYQWLLTGLAPSHPSLVGLKGSNKSMRDISRDTQTSLKSLQEVLLPILSWNKVVQSAAVGHLPSVQAIKAIKDLPNFSSIEKLKKAVLNQSKFDSSLNRANNEIQRSEENVRKIEAQLREANSKLAQQISSRATLLEEIANLDVAASTKLAEPVVAQIKTILEDPQVSAARQVHSVFAELDLFKANIDSVEFGPAGKISWQEEKKSYLFSCLDSSAATSFPDPTSLYALLAGRELTTIEICLSEPFINSYRTNEGKCPQDWAYLLSPMKFRYVAEQGGNLAFWRKDAALKFQHQSYKVHPHTPIIEGGPSHPYDDFVGWGYPDAGYLGGFVCVGNLSTFLTKSMAAGDLSTTLRASLGWVVSNAGPADTWSADVARCEKITFKDLLRGPAGSPFQNMSLDEVYLTKDGEDVLFIFDNPNIAKLSTYIAQFQGKVETPVPKRYATYAVPVSSFTRHDGFLHIDIATIERFTPVASSTKRLRAMSGATKIDFPADKRYVIGGMISIQAPKPKASVAAVQESACSES